MTTPSDLNISSLFEPTTRQAIIADPKSHLTKQGISIADNVQVKAVICPKNVLYIALEPSSSSMLLGSDDLDKIQAAGSASTVGSVGSAGTVSTLSSTLGTTSSAATVGSSASAG